MASMIHTGAATGGTETFSTREFGPHQLEELATSQLEHALDARRRGLKIYESLKNLNDVIGTQYGDRVLFELVQNAHDAHRLDEQGEIAIRLLLEDEKSGTLLVANRGRSFTFSNLDAIRNIGTSDKEIGEGIGNKGLGFRSVEALTDDPRIYSQSEGNRQGHFSGYCFRFAGGDEIRDRLDRLGAPRGVRSQVAENISRYLVPLPLTEQSEEILRFAEAGFATVVELPLRSADAVELAQKQVSALASPDAPILLFLERLSALDIQVRVGAEPLKKVRLTRGASKINALPSSKAITLREVELNEGAPFLVVRSVLPKEKLLEAVKESIPVAPTLKRWLKWKGDAVVSVAVGLRNEAVRASRLFNFLPMDDNSTGPLHGYVDAPFFADIDRRSMKPDLPLNRYLLESAAEACAAAALTITRNGLNIPKASVVDLITWAPPHVNKIVAGFARLNQDFTKAEVWPIVADGQSRWGSLEYLYAWPDAATKFLKPRRLVQWVDAEILPSDLGSDRSARIRRLSTSVGKPVDLTAATLCDWVVGAARSLSESKSARPSQWQDFYEDVVALFEGSSVDLSELQGKAFLRGGSGDLLQAAAEGTADAEPVFVRPRETKGRRTSGPPKPPGSLSRRLKFFDDAISLSDETLRSFEKAGLVRKYDAIEVLSGLSGALGKKPTDNQRNEALIWAFKVWRSIGGGRAVEEALRKASLFVPTLSGWSPATDAFFSSSWSNSGKILEPYLSEAAAHSADCACQRDRLLMDYQNWISASHQDRKSDWFKFLEALKVRDGLHPIAGKIRRTGTPNNYWHSLFSTGNADLGLVRAWTDVVRHTRLNNSQTEYRLEGECWRLPGQLEHEVLPKSARETLSELIVAYLKDRGDEHFTFRVRHWRGWEAPELPTPLQIFLKEAKWTLSFRRDEAVLRRPRETWSSQTVRQVPPRFVERFAAEPGHHSPAPALLFDPRIGLRDWTAPHTAPQRLTALAEALADLSAAERRDLRDQLRRSWTDIATGDFTLPEDFVLVVERHSGLDACKACPEDRPIIHLTSERQGFAARALIDQGAAILDLGNADILKVSSILESTRGFDLRPVNTGDVRMIVDGADFEPARSDPLLATGALSWISDAAMLAHEFLGDPLELRTLPPEAVEQRIRQIRVRHSKEFSLVIGDHVVSARGHERVHPFSHAQMPTLIVAGSGKIDLDLLIEAAPALTKLVGTRRNTLETMLTRLVRSGFLGQESGPTHEQYARAIQREVAIIRDHFAATHGGIERRVTTILPVVCYLAGEAAANRLTEVYSKLGPLLPLRDWLAEELGEERAESVWGAVEDTDDQGLLRRRLGLDFSGYNAVLTKLGYPALNDEEDFKRLFEVYLNELRPRLLERIRRRHLGAYQRGESLQQYLEHKTLGFVAFDPAWPPTMEELDRSFVERYAFEQAELVLGLDDGTIELQDLKRLHVANQKMTLAAHPRMASLVRAWCRKNSQQQPTVMDPSDAQPLLKSLEQSGLFDFERLLPDQLPALCKRINAWPTGMAETLDPGTLSLDEADLDFEEREAREARRKSEIARRSITFGATSLDTGASDFAQMFAELADKSLSSGKEWLSRSRVPRLKTQEEPEAGRDTRRGRGGTGQNGGRGDQPPEPIRRAMGIASEYLAREYLIQRHPQQMTDRCWASKNRELFCSDGEKGDDSLGYDFRVVTARNEYLYEVKSALDEGGEFELTARELEVAGSAALDRKRRYRILYVPFVFDPDRWRVWTLHNPVGEATRSRFKVIRTGSVRYGFEVK